MLNYQQQHEYVGSTFLGRRYDQTDFYNPCVVYDKYKEKNGCDFFTLEDAKDLAQSCITFDDARLLR